MLEENWHVVQVFQLCQQSWAVHLGGAQALGFSALEVDAACRLAATPPDDLTTTATHALEMGRIAAGVLNARKP